MAFDKRPTYDELLERVEALEKRTIALKDLPLAPLQRKLEADWRPSGPVLLGESSITPGMLAAPPQARVYNNANISVPNATATTLTFNSQRFASDNIHTAGSSRLVAPTAGLYAIGAHVQLSPGAGTFRELWFEINGTGTVIADTLSANVAAIGRLYLSTLYQFAAGEYVEARVYQDSGGALNANTAPNYTPEFWIVRLGPSA